MCCYSCSYVELHHQAKQAQLSKVHHPAPRDLEAGVLPSIPASVRQNRRRPLRACHSLRHAPRSETACFFRSNNPSWEYYAGDRGETVAMMEPLLMSENSRHRGELTDLAVELAGKSAGFRRSLARTRNARRPRAGHELLP